MANTVKLWLMQNGRNFLLIVRLCLPFPCVSTPLYVPSCFLSLVHSSPSVFDLLLTWCCFPWLCYVFISPESSLSLGPSTRLCTLMWLCVLCSFIKSHYLPYLSSPASFPLHDRDRLTDQKKDGGAPPPPAADLGLPFAGVLRRRPRLAQPAVRGKSAAVRGSRKLAVRRKSAAVRGSRKSASHRKPTSRCSCAPGLVGDIRGDGLEPSPRACSSPAPSGDCSSPAPSGACSVGPVQLTFASAGPVQLTLAHAGPVQLTWASAGPVQLTLASAGPVQLTFASAGPVQLTFASAGSVQLPLASAGPVQLTLASAGLVQRPFCASWAPPKLRATRVPARVSATRAPTKVCASRAPPTNDNFIEFLF